jgi:hypothetical protein
LAALLLEDVPTDDRFVAPDEPWPSLHRALSAQLATPAGDAQPPTVAAGDLAAAADGITDKTVTLLTVLGPDAVAADPLLPLRVRHHAAALPPLGPRPRALLGHDERHAETIHARAVGQRRTGGVNGLRRDGVVTNLLQTQLALPDAVFAARFAGGELLYRQFDGNVESLVDRVTLLLDTTPATFGPIEGVLRLVAHIVTTAMWSAKRNPELICLGDPQRTIQLSTQTDLLTLWTSRSLGVPDMRTAIDRCAADRTAIVLTEHHFAREYPIVADERLRVVTSHAPGDPPKRHSASPYHVHLPPQPGPDQLAGVVAKLLTPAGAR